MRDASTTPIFTLGFKSGQASRNASRVLTWNSSGKTWMSASRRYGCAMSSLQLITCSSTLGSTVPLYSSSVMPSSCVSTSRFFPTKSRSSRRSFSRRSLSRLPPPCCIRTHSLFISVKFWRTNSTASLTSPPDPSYSLPVSGSSVLLAWLRYVLRNNPWMGCCTPFAISTRSRSTSFAPPSLLLMYTAPTVMRRYSRGKMFPACCTSS